MMGDDAPFASSTTRRRRNGWLWVALAAFLLGIAATVAVVRYAGERIGLAPATPPATTRSARVPVTLPPRGASPSDLTTLDARETALSGRIAELEGRLAALDTDSRVASSFATRAEGLMVAFAARRALDRGLALGYLEDQLRRRFGSVEPQATNTVIAAAHDPVTLETLRLLLDDAAPRLSAGDPDEGWWTGIRRELSQLVILRRDASPSSLPAERLARARRRLDAGQVEGALAEIVRLPGAANAERWIEAAKRYIEARRALNAIETVAIQGGGVLPPSPMPLPAPVPDTVTALPLTAPDPATGTGTTDGMQTAAPSNE